MRPAGREEDTAIIRQTVDQPMDQQEMSEVIAGESLLVAFRAVLDRSESASPCVAQDRSRQARIAAFRIDAALEEDLSPIPVPLRIGVPKLGSPITTGGGVAFLRGTLDYYVRAYDVTTGEVILSDRLPAGGQATPKTYQGADGRQYVVVVAGGHGSGTKGGDSIIAYALPDN